MANRFTTRLVHSRPLGGPRIVPLRMDRREFLVGAPTGLFAGSVVVGGLTILPSGCGVKDERTAFLLIAAVILGFSAAYAVYQLSDDVGGMIELKNDTRDDMEGEVQLGLVDGSNEVVDGGRAGYTVPAGYINTYEWSGLHANEAGEHRARAESAANAVESMPFAVE